MGLGLTMWAEINKKGLGYVRFKKKKNEYARPSYRDTTNRVLKLTKEFPVNANGAGSTRRASGKFVTGADHKN